MNYDVMNAPRLIDTVPSSRQIQQAYDAWSVCYDKVAAPWEHGPRLRALQAAGIRSGENVLDVGVGTGAIVLQILAQVHKATRIFGIDLSVGMLGKARSKIAAAGYESVYVFPGDARALPFKNRSFDVVYSAYTLDLMSLSDVQVAVAEFRRVLKPDGRLVLVNMSKEQASRTSWVERLYKLLPPSWAAYLLGGCRPVVLDEAVRSAGFCNVRREFVWNIIPSEIVFGRSPGLD